MFSAGETFRYLRMKWILGCPYLDEWACIKILTFLVFKFFIRFDKISNTKPWQSLHPVLQMAVKTLYSTSLQSSSVHVDDLNQNFQIQVNYSLRPNFLLSLSLFSQCPFIKNGFFTATILRFLRTSSIMNSFSTF